MTLPDARFTDPAQLAEAFERADAGQRLVWASGPSSLMAPDNATQLLVREWYEARRATMVQGKDLREAGRWLFYVVKLAEPAPVAEPADTAPPKARPIPDRMPHDARRLLALLADHAGRALPCPSNEAIADLLDLDGPRRARTLFGVLVQLGLVRVIEPARFGPRVIEIAASGARTANIEQGSKAHG